MLKIINIESFLNNNILVQIFSQFFFLKKNDIKTKTSENFDISIFHSSILLNISNELYI
jgi:hypothetical protein